MTSVFPKNKNLVLNAVIKVIIVLAFIWVIYRQISGRSEITGQWFAEFQAQFSDKLPLLIFALALLPLNLWVESIKWKIMVNRFEPHSSKHAYLSILSGIIAGIITPARIGDYVGKLMFISPQNNWKAVWSNLVGSIAQNVVIIWGGISGSVFFLYYHVDLETMVFKSLVVSGLIVSLLLLVLYYHLKWIPLISQKFNRLGMIRKILSSLSVMFHFTRPTLHKVLFFSLLRYVIFNVQYYLLLRFWGIDGNVLILVSAITIIFLVQSAIPLPPLIGLLARGEIALFILGNISSNSVGILSAAFSLWIINLGIPALFGLFILLNINITKTLGYE